MEARMNSMNERIEQLAGSANLDNSMNERVEKLFDVDDEMTRVRKRVMINGDSFWLTAADEQELFSKLVHLKDSGTSSRSKPQSHNFAAYVKLNWMYIEQTVALQTAKEYRIYLNNDILPFFGEMDIENIDWRDVQRFYNLLADKARQTVHKRKIVLSRLMQIAVGDKIILVDPTKNKKLVYSRIVQQRAVPDMDEYRKIAAEIPNLSESHYRLYMALITFTGMRKGEALALRWENVSFEKDEIHIYQSVRLDKTDDGKAEIKAPKTKAGIRTVPMIEPLKQILMPLKKDKGFVVIDARKGKPVHSDASFNTMWRYIKKEMDVEKYSSHSFRHAVATFYISNGVDIKTTQTIMGHSQPSTTMNIYAHAVPRNIENAAKIFNDAVFSSV